MSGCERVDDAAIGGLPENAVALRCARLPRVTDAAFEIIAERCPRLRALDCRGCAKLTQRSVFALLGIPAHVSSLEECSRHVYPRAGLDAKKIRHLRRLDFGACPFVDRDAVSACVSRHPYLTFSIDATVEDVDAVDALYEGLADAYPSWDHARASLHWTCSSLDLEERDVLKNDRRDSIRATNMCKRQYRTMKAGHAAKEARFEKLVVKDESSVAIQAAARRRPS